MVDRARIRCFNDKTLINVLAAEGNAGANDVARVHSPATTATARVKPAVDGQSRVAQVEWWAIDAWRAVVAVVDVVGAGQLDGEVAVPQGHPETQWQVWHVEAPQMGVKPSHWPISCNGIGVGRKRAGTLDRLRARMLHHVVDVRPVHGQTLGLDRRHGIHIDRLDAKSPLAVLC